MKAYSVIIDSLAKQDMLDIRRYISLTLKNSAAAERIYTSMKTAISTLDQNPKRQAVVREEPYASLGIRALSVENYVAFYMVNEAGSRVNVFRVLYNRREWQNLL